MTLRRRLTRSPALRRGVRGAIDRLPVGRGTALRFARGVATAGSPSAAAARGVVIGGAPATFVVSPRPTPIGDDWPETPLVDDGAKTRRYRHPNGPPDGPFDIDLFEALNAEYRDRPVVPAPRGNDAASAAARARQRLRQVHDSIDLRGGRVLEFGCGAGYEVWTLSHHFGCEATGVDVVERRAWDTLADERTRYVLADVALDRPFAADAFDRIVSFSVFEHVVHPRATLTELHRILRPGGLMWLSANLHRGPMASHKYREVFFPWPHLLFGDDVFREFYRRNDLPPQGAAWVNRLSWTEYAAMFATIGFRLRSARFSEATFDEPFYRRFEGVLGRYPRLDLGLDFFHVVLEKVS
ncbi:MAG TPA: methyltransferase domain-containing protein [Candidatus Limnocylindrales bacterium]